jgi:3',5'-cyclic AMP phosphodiesterase CpdA
MLKPLNILHLSDLHFGRIDQTVLINLKKFLEDHQDTITHYILTGDLTQRARSHEFMGAAEFLKSLEKPLFLVPGNHDIPLYNLYQRIFSPYKKFLKFFESHSQNFYEDDRLAIFGLWTTNNLTVSQGKIKQQQLEELIDKFQHVGPEKIRIIASHHPLFSQKDPMSSKAQSEILNLKPHLVLSGHEHYAQVRHFSQESVLPICISSGTSTSTRLRVQSNGFNLISILNDELEVKIYQFDSGQGEFVCEEKFSAKL